MAGETVEAGAEMNIDGEIAAARHLYEHLHLLGLETWHAGNAGGVSTGLSIFSVRNLCLSLRRLGEHLLTGTALARRCRSCAPCAAFTVERSGSMISTNAFATSSQALKFSFCAMEGVTRATARYLEALSELNGEVLRVAFDEHSAIVAQARSPAEITTLQIGALGAAPQKAVSYWQHVGTIVVEACSGIALDIRHCFSQTSPQGLEFLDSLVSGARKR
ncbi:hypothetical protein C2L65_43750 [Paraburkholderia terrae]|uniref:Phasin domain-containing protein n=2 Tax=Paraburkholderia terrae TaxID=311230 RepID=A0A2I8F3Y3_9BURK|nr:hypothetical protein C2L65_43750 [Paraburkholderia terrae]